MQGSGGSATPEKTSFAKRYFDADGSSRCHCHLCSVSLIGQSEVCASKDQRIRSLWACSGNCVSGRTMIATCSNPACNVPFLYFRSGKIFVLEANDVDPKSTTDPAKRRIELFWLCGECAPGMDLMRTTDGEVTICQSPRPSGSLVALRIACAFEVTGLGLEHRRFKESQVS